MIVFLELLAVLLAMAACWKYMDRVIEEKKDRTVLYLFFVMITMVYGISVRFYQGAYPEDLFGAAVLKFCASLPSVVLGLKGYLMEKNRFDLLIVIALITGLLADVSINLSMIAGAALFGIGHLLYDIAFIREKRPSRKQILVWLIITVLLDGVLFLLKEKFPSPSLLIPGMIYIAILVSTVVFSTHLPKIIFVSAAVFAVSDIFLIVNIVVSGNILMKTAALLIYYGAMLMYGIAIWELTYPEKKL
ncbi:MAG: hypothetical protein IIZ33_02025 [Erysipelotrichaceae bacterium]|nr:hypothetical protein [Erysipelotrichaceae bacterium]